MSKIPNELLGKKLEDYLLHDYNPKEVLPGSLVQLLDSDYTVNKILAKKDVAAKTLHDLTRLVLVPTRLLSLRGTRILPALMDLFGSYCQHHRPYEYEFGFYCVEAILFTLGIAVLGKTDALKMYVHEAMALSSQAPARLLHEMMEKCLGPSLQMCEKPDKRNEILWGFDSLTQTLAPALGGFTLDDLHYIINAVWEDRKQMFWAHTITGVSPGWRYGIFILFLFHRRKLRNYTLVPKIYAVAMRLELSSPQDEYHLLDLVLEMTCTTPSSPSGLYPENDIIDTEDAKLVLRKYHPWIILLDQKYWKTSNLCTLWAGSIVLQLNELEFYLEMLKSHLRVIWSGILEHDEHTRELTKTTPLLLFINTTLKYIEFIINKAVPEDRTACINMLFTGGDFVNLMGRTLLWFPRFAEMYASNEEIFGGLKGQLEMFNEALVVLARATGPLVSHSAIGNSYTFNIWADRTKVLMFLQYSYQTYLTTNDQTLCAYLKAAKNTWEEFGRMVPYVSDQYCANPDCRGPGPAMSCTRCCKVRYCNQKCQKWCAYTIIALR
ncbi:hypothetical protein FS749_007471 [Ceratobasidium sp. UAMH 11750]|nr:hypothetical protein FS749_007471 [Ceratobasidium sp. UAMH 11750]